MFESLILYVRYNLHLHLWLGYIVEEKEVRLSKYGGRIANTLVA